MENISELPDAGSSERAGVSIVKRLSETPYNTGGIYAKYDQIYRCSLRGCNLLRSSAIAGKYVGGRFHTPLYSYP
jgi:hypothetical protein